MATRKKKRTSPLRRLIYFALMILTGGGAGIGGWAFRDYPQLQALVSIFLGDSTNADIDSKLKPDVNSREKVKDLKSSLVTAVSEALNRDDPRKGGVFKVKITEVKLDPKQFPLGRTVDLQARVQKIDSQGKETVVWESKTFGENLYRVGKDDLTATWINRPFEIEWRPGDQIVVEVWDRRSVFFDRKSYKMALPEPGTFPLATGTHALGVMSSRDRSLRDSDLNRIVFQSQRIGDSTPKPPPQFAERPIVIK